jgi:hypothetical protein
MKRLLVLTVLILALCGCGGGDGGGDAPPVSSPAMGGGGGGTGSGGGSANAAPTISGRPLSAVTVAQQYAFQPVAKDADGDTLSFSAANLPSWATLDAKTGRVSGTPTAADVGIYQGITITVSDGRASATLGPFSIEVSAIANGAATLSWSPPTENADGTPLTDLAGYRIRYGRSATELGSLIEITNPSLSAYVVENLSPGTWYFTVVAVNRAGVESEPSGIASKTV